MPKSKDQKRTEALERQALRDKRGDNGQIARLNSLRHTAKRERAKLAARKEQK